MPVEGSAQCVHLDGDTIKCVRLLSVNAMALTDLTDEIADGKSRGGGSSGEYERFDVSGASYVKMHPGPTAIGGTVVALRYFPPALDSEDDNPRGYGGLVLQDPYIVTDDDTEDVSIYSSTSSTGDDYKVVNMADRATEELDGVGLEFDKNVFRGESTEDFAEDEVIVKLSGRAGRSVMATLDVHGSGSADIVRTEQDLPLINEYGYPTRSNSLIEYCPDNDDNNYSPPRFSRDTQLRPDLDGEEVVFVLERAENKPALDTDSGYWATVMSRDGDGFTELSPTEEFEPDESLVLSTGYLEWHRPDAETIATACRQQGVEVPEKIQDQLDS